MADAFLSLPAVEQRNILETAAARSGRLAVILEKDIWICWALRILFSIPDRHPMAFKGGTSLSKVYGIIDRFSEDVDITLDYRAFAHGFDPFAPGVSRSRIGRFSKQLKSSVDSYIRNVVGPALGAAARRLPMSDRHAVRIDRDGERVWFSYPSAVENPVGYLASEVLLEFGGRNVIDPNEQHEIVSDIAALTSDLDFPVASCPRRAPLEIAFNKVLVRYAG